MKKSEILGDLATALEQAAAAVRKLESADEIVATKSSNEAGDGATSSAPRAGKKSAPAAAAAVATKPAKGAKAKAAAITLDVLRAKLTELVNAKGKDVAREILSGLGAAKLTDLDEDNYADAHAQAVEKLNEEEEEAAEDDDTDLFGE